jgi:SsrA-binding protein
LLDFFTAGLVLQGTEIKSIRQSKANINDAYCLFENGSLIVRNMHIAEYDHGNIMNHTPLRDRKLLLTQRELNKIEGKLKDAGKTIVPLKLFVSDKGFAKLEIALARGKKLYDKRDSLKQKDIQRDIDRGRY